MNSLALASARNSSCLRGIVQNLHEHRGRHAEWRGDLLELTQTERSVERRKSKEPLVGTLGGVPDVVMGVDDTAVSRRDISTVAGDHWSSRAVGCEAVR